MVSSVNSTDGTYEQQCKHTKTLCKPRCGVSSPLWSNCIYHTKTIYTMYTLHITHHITTRPTTCANPGVVFPLHCSRSFLLCRLTCCSSQGSRKLVRMLNSFFKAPSYWIRWKFELSAWYSNQGSKKLVRTVNCPF